MPYRVVFVLGALLWIWKDGENSSTKLGSQQFCVVMPTWRFSVEEEEEGVY